MKTVAVKSWPSCMVKMVAVRVAKSHRTTIPCRWWKLVPDWVKCFWLLWWMNSIKQDGWKWKWLCFSLLPWFSNVVLATWSIESLRNSERMELKHIDTYWAQFEANSLMHITLIHWGYISHGLTEGCKPKEKGYTDYTPLAFFS